MPLHRSLAVTLAMALCVVSGCGSVPERTDAASTVALGLLSAVQSQDGGAACAVLAPDTVAELEDSAGKPCATAILDEDLPAPDRVTSADVYGQWARVVLSDDTVFLAMFQGGWRVVAAGCTARAERPYDCSVQGT